MRPNRFGIFKNAYIYKKTNVLYETTVKDFNFKPSDECIEMRFFSKEEALKENLYPIVKEFINEFNPDNH